MGLRTRVRLPSGPLKKSVNIFYGLFIIYKFHKKNIFLFSNLYKSDIMRKRIGENYKSLKFILEVPYEEIYGKVKKY